MRGVLAIAAEARSVLRYHDFSAAGHDDILEVELERLAREGLIDGDVYFARGFNERSACSVDGLTEEGMAFYKLIENDDVWEIVLSTLKAANVDVSYPLLKEVCEEIVKRYVTSFIPDL